MCPDENIENLISEARERGSKSQYHGCATATFTAIVDTLGLKYGDECFKAMIGLAGGTGHFTKGTCGALAGAAAAISLAYSKSREEVAGILEDRRGLHPLNNHIPEFFQEIFDKIAWVAERVKERYGGILCSEVQFNVYGKTYNLLDPKEHWDFVKMNKLRPVNCQTIEGEIAGWTVEVILTDSPTLESRKS